MRFLAICALTGLVAAPLKAQLVRLRVDAVGLTYQEVRDGRSVEGAGGGAAVEVRFKRFHLDARGYQARLTPDSAAEYDLRQFDVRLGFDITPVLGIEVGGGRRTADPDFVTQDVGLLRVGVYSANPLTRLAEVWVRGAYLIDPRFSGGGSADLAFEFALGVGVGTANGRFRGLFEYEFQRIDRSVADVDVPLQLSIARVGVAVGLF